MITFASIDQSIARGDADIGLSGIEDTPARRATLAVTIPYYEFREVLGVRDRRRRTAADARGPARHAASATLGGTIAYEILLRAEREHGLQRRVVRRRRAPVQRSAARTRRRGAARQRARRAAPARRCRDSPSSRQTVAIGHYVGVLAPANAALRDAIERRAARRDARRHARADLPEVERLERRPAGALRAAAGRRSRCRPSSTTRLDATIGAATLSRMGGGAALPPVAAAGVGRDPRAVLPVDGAGGRARRADRDRPRLRRAGRCGSRSSATSS